MVEFIILAIVPYLICQIYEPAAAWTTLIFFVVSGVFIMFALDGYNFELRYALYQQIGFIIAICIFFLILALIANTIQRISLVSWRILLIILLFIGAFLITLRKLYLLSLMKPGARERVCILGKNWLANLIADELKKKVNLGWDFIGFIDSADGNNYIYETNQLSIKVDINDDLLNRHNITRIVDSRTSVIDLSPGRLTPEMKFDVSISSNYIIHGQDFFEIITRRIPIPQLNTKDIVSVNYIRARKHVHDLVWSVMNVLLAFTGIMFTMPIWIITALAIKIEDNGSIFFIQDRVGLYGKIFCIYKFRTMKDNNITKVGSIIRRFRIDEFPQFINIIRRELNFVGPRPFVPDESKYFESKIPIFNKRYLVMPGVTGLAQVSHRYENELSDAWIKLGYDLYYVKNRGYFLDLLIMLWSVGAVMFGKGK